MSLTRKKALSFCSLLSLTLVIVVGYSLIPSLALADETLFSQQEGMKELGKLFPSGSGEPDIRITIVQIIRVAIGMIGAIFLALMVFAGFQYMTSAGNEEKTKKSLGLIKNAVIGLIIVMASWIITSAMIRYIFLAVNNQRQL
ncbi:MAG: pilin [Patescibacteria group bacterium]|jgi:hypothetical protein